MLKYKTVRGLLKHRLFRAVITCSLVLLQVHFLWVAVLHRHEAMIPCGRAHSVCGRSGQPRPVVEAGLLCTACQIVRHSAARPAVSMPAPAPAVAIPLRSTFPPSGFSSHQPVVAFGRAPPLS